MKKLFFFLLAFISLSASAQIYQAQNGYGFQYKRLKIDSTLHIPTFNGAPNLRNSVDSGNAAIAFDSANNKVYFYNPKTKTWSTISATASDITGLISEGSNITITGTGTSGDPYVINSTGGSGNTKYILQGYGIIVDSSGDNYTIKADTSAFKDSLYVGKGITNDITSYPGHNLIKIDSQYVRDTSLNLAGGTINQVLKKNSSTNGDWSWQDESGSGAGCDTCISTVTLSGDSVVYFIRQNGDTAKALAWSGSGGLSGLLSLTGYAPIIVDNSDSLNPIIKADTNTAITGLATKAFVTANTSSILNADSAYIQIQSNIGGTAISSPIKGLRLQNMRSDLVISNATSQSAPPIIFKAYRWNGTTAVPYFVSISTISNTASSGASLSVRYSLDSSIWSNSFNISASDGGLTMGVLSATAGTFSGQVGNGTSWLIRSDGRVSLGQYAAPSNQVRLQLVDTSAGFLVNRMSTNARNLLSGPISLTLISGGSGYLQSSYPTTSTGYGTGLVITAAVSGGVVTSGIISAKGQNYRLGDTVTISGAGSGTASFVISALQGDLNPGLMVNDTSLNKIMVWDNHLHGWVSQSGYSGRYSFTASSTSTFTVNIGATLPYVAYSVNVDPTSSIAAAPFYITNKTATTFDVVYLSPLTGTVTFDWSVKQ